MLSLALAYHTNNQSAADRIVADLSPPMTVATYRVDDSAEGPLLVDLVEATDVGVVLLIGNDFLTSVSTVGGINDFFQDRSGVLPVFVADTIFDAERGENVAGTVNLQDAAVREKYVRYWREELDKIGAQANQDNFPPERQTTLERVAGIANSIEPLLAYLSDGLTVTQADLERGDYNILFETFGVDDKWEAFMRERAESLAAIPGVGLLAKSDPISEPGAGAGAVQGGTALPGVATAQTPAADDADADADGAPMSYEVEADAQAEVWINRAWALYESDRPEPGLELLATGKESLPDHPDIAYNYALMLAMDTEMPQAALLELEKLLQEFHDHAGALFLSGELSLSLGNYESAYLDWLQLSDVDPLYPDLNYRLGMLISDHLPERHSEALTYLRRASRDKPVNGDARYRYAMMQYHQLGSTKKAIKWLKRTIDSSPEHAAAHYALAMLYHKRGKFTAARNYYRTAVRLDPAFDTPRNQEAFARNLQIDTGHPDGNQEPVQRLQSRVEQLENLLVESGVALPSGLAAPGTYPADPAPALRDSELPGTGKTVFISGASSGIGRATAYALARDGYRLILLGRRTERLEELRRELKQDHQTKSLAITADVRDREGLRSKLDKLPKEWRNVDVLLNNAGKAKGFDPIHEGSYEHWDEMIDVNLKGLLTLTREITPRMVKRGRGTIINVCSTAGKEVYPNGNVYCATKHAVDALTYAMRLDLVKHGIRVGQICPAHVEETEFAVVRFDGDRKRAKIYEDFQPLRSQDVAEAVRFMLAQPPHVTIMDVVLQGTQQASSTVVDRSGRDKFAPSN